MKKLTAVTMALALALCVAPSYAALADGDNSGECVYPEEFITPLTFSALADYAFCGDARAFADSTYLYIIEPDEYGDEQPTTFNCGAENSTIGYDAEGNLYLEMAGGGTYLYQNTGLVPADFDDFTINNSELLIEEYYYYLRAQTTGELYVIDTGNDNENKTLFDSGCSNLKQYDGTAYVMHDGEIYVLNGTEEPEMLVIEYTDFTAANSINTANAAEILASSGYEVQLVNILSIAADGYDTYVTKISLDDLGATFRASGTKKINATCSALAIAEVGNATRVVMEDESGITSSYITRTASVEPISYTAGENDMQTAYALTDIGIYSRPYICEATKIGEIAQGTVFDNITEKFSLEFIDEQFYRVTCTVDGEEITGFVAAGLLSPYTFAADGEEEQTAGGENFEYGNNIVTVIVILLIVLLVLIAVGYVIFYMTRKDDSKGRRRKKSPPADDDLYT